MKAVASLKHMYESRIAASSIHNRLVVILHRVGTRVLASTDKTLPL